MNKIFIQIDKNLSVQLKGIAILCVLMCHIGLQYGIRYFGILGSVGVSIFLILSGYGINESYKKNQSPDGYWLRKFNTLYPGYIIVQILMFIVPVIDMSVKQLIKNIFFVDSNQYYIWYIYEIVFCYASYYIIYFNKKIDSKFLALLIVMVMHFFALDFLYSIQSVAFICGVACSEYKSTNEYNFKYLLFFCFFAGTLFISLRQINMIRQLGFLYQQLMVLIINTSYAYFVILFYKKYRSLIYPKIIIGLGFLGTMSYEIYLTHGYIIRLKNTNIIYKLLIILTCSWAIKKIQKSIKRK